MVKLYFLATCFLIASIGAKAQAWNQYFDGADTSVFNSILFSIDTTGGNVWQIGPPQKTIFDSAASVPNVLVTDTINFYPSNDSSYAQCKVNVWTSWGILALQWKQKLDLDSAMDVGIIEYSLDTGNTWTTIFNDPHVYNFYGYDSTNVDTVASGVVGFTGRDTSWSDIWLCYDMSWLSVWTDTVYFRFKIMTDSVNNNSEGWMIDNMNSHLTIFHTAKGELLKPYLSVYPTPTSGIVYIETIHVQEFHIIEKMELIDVNGRVVKEWKNCPTKYWIDISDQPNGSYFLRVQTNLRTNTTPVILNR